MPATPDAQPPTPTPRIAGSFSFPICTGRTASTTAADDSTNVAVGPFVYFMVGMIFLTAVVHVFKVFVPGSRRANQATN